MRIVALVKNAEHVCCRYRIAAFRGALERAGHELIVRPRPQAWLARLLLKRTLGSPDALILQRKLPSPWQLPLLRRVAPLLIFDFDDAVFLRDSYAPQGVDCAYRARDFAAVVRAADAVVAGNSYLRDNAARLVDPGKVHVIPTCVDARRYPLAEHRVRGAGVQLTWIGSSSTLRGLEMIRPTLERLGQRCPGLRLKIICDKFLHLDHLTVVPCPWSEETEAADLAAADVGLSWLPDDPWSRGKCGLKLLQYMAAGLPVIANAVGMQTQVVRHGETGYLVNTAEEVIAAAARLAADPELRQRLGRAGRRLVEENFDVRSGAALWTALLSHLGASARTPRAG